MLDSSLRVARDSVVSQTCSFAADGRLKSILKNLRVSQPFNWIATSTVKAVLRASNRPSEFIIKHLHRVGRIRTRLPNGRMLSLCSWADDWIPNQVYWRGWDGYEPETVPVFFRLCATASVTVDIGAHVGLYSLLAAHANPKGHVYAFEPMPNSFARLCTNIGANKLHNVTALDCAVGDCTGERPFFYTPTDIPCSASLSREFMESADTLSHMNVSVIRLDEFGKQRRVGRIDVLKVDTESTEPDVLRGAREILQRDRPAIICEVLRGRGTEGRLDELLRPLGYKYFWLTADGPLQQEEIVGRDPWMNYLFTTRPELVVE